MPPSIILDSEYERKNSSPQLLMSDHLKNIDFPNGIQHATKNGSNFNVTSESVFISTLSHLVHSSNSS